MLISVEEAIAKLKAAVSPQHEMEKVALIDGVGRVLAADICADFAVPSYPKSAMDGYAVRSRELKGATKENPVRLKVLGQINAGDSADYAAGERTAVRIMTGGEVPQEYDAVIMQEQTDYGRDTVEIYAEVGPWQNYCRVGEDIKQGELVMAAGTYLTPVHIGVIASLGKDSVQVKKPLKVALLSTGNELIELGTQSDQSRTYDSLKYQIAASLHTDNVAVVAMAHADDITEDIGNCILHHKSKADVIITTGGLSVGDKDLMPFVLQQLGADVLFRGVFISPGTPVTAACLDGCLILCFAGQPFACMTNLQVFFWQVLAQKMACPDLLPRLVHGTVKTGSLEAKKIKKYVRVKFVDGAVMIAKRGHNASMMSSAMDTNAFLVQGAGCEIREGDEVLIQLFK